MKTKILLIILITLSALTIPSAQKALHAEDGVKIPLSFYYSSTYWWRGIELLGKGVGVFWPGVALEVGGFSIGCTAGISQGWITSEKSEPPPGTLYDDLDGSTEAEHKKLTEIDYSISYKLETEMVNLGVSLFYYQWPFYDEEFPGNEDAKDPAFWEGAISLTLNTILNPSVEFYYDYYVETHKGGYDGSGEKILSKQISPTEDVPVDEDYYIKLGVSQDLISTKDGFTFTAIAYVGYYNDPYYEMSGWSDAVASLGIAKDEGNFSFNAGMYYGRTLGKDYRINKYFNDGQKNHFWCDFGITYTL